MFSFPNKERSLEWIQRAITNHWPGTVNSGTEIQMEGHHVASVSTTPDEYAERQGTDHWERSGGPASDSSSDGFIQGSHGPETGSNDLDYCFLDGAREHVVLDMGQGCAGDGGGTEQVKFSEDGGVRHGILLGGVILGGLVIPVDEGSDPDSDVGSDTTASPGAENLIQGGLAGGGQEGRVEENGVVEEENSEDRVGQEGDCGRGRLQDGHVVVDMEASDQAFVTEKAEPVLTGPSRYLKRCQDMSYYLGVSGFKPFQNKKADKWYFMAGRILQKIVNSPVLLASIVQSLFMIKRSYLGILFGHSYTSYVGFAFAFACFLVKIYSTYMTSFKKKKTERMLMTMHEYEETVHSNQGSNGSFWKLKLVSLLAISTLICAGAIPVLQSGGATTEDLILDASYELSRDVFKWTPNMTEKDTLALKLNYAVEMNGRTVTMGIFVLFRDAASYLQIWVALDLVVMVTIVMFAYVAPLIKEIKAATPNVPFERHEEWMALQARREEIWRKYVKLRKVKDEVNDLFDPLLKLLHMRNLTTYAFFMSLVFLESNPWIFLLIFAVNLFKAEIAYFLAGKIAEVNDALRGLIHNWAENTGTIRVGEEEFDAGIILDRLEKDPIGLGNGKFLIHHEFHFKFVACVWSVFFSMADEEQGE